MRRWTPHFLLVLAMLATFLAYHPGLSGPFVFDDNVNIVRNTSLAMHDLNFTSFKEAAFSSNSGLLLRPISMLSFALNEYATGPNPFYFKLTNLLIHLLNGVGIFVLTQLLLSFYQKKFEPPMSPDYIRWISLAVSAAWLLHPLGLTSVLYSVQRMTSLSAFFSLFGLIMFLWGRVRLHAGNNGIYQILTSFLLFTPLAAMSKENGALLPAFMLIVEISLFHFHTKTLFARRFLIGFYIISVGIPFMFAMFYLAIHWEWLLAGYKTRAFSLPERLMTEVRVIWFYIWQIIAPNNTALGLYHDDIEISKSLLHPPGTLFSIIGLSALLAISWATRKSAPIITFGILFFLTGHLLESTIWPLELVHEHRNYLPMYGVILVTVFYLLYPLYFRDILRLRQLVVFLMIGLFAFNTFTRANQWSNPYDLFQAEVTHHPNSAIVNGEMGALYSNVFSPDPDSMASYYANARQYFEKAAELDKNDTKPLFGLIFLSVNRDKPIETSWVDELKLRLQTAPYAAVTSDKLNALTQCQLGGTCKLPNRQLEALLLAALKNPTLSGSNRAKILYAEGNYLINISRDYNGALEIMQQTIQTAPANEVEYRFNLINFLIALERLDDAKTELDKLKKLDLSQPYLQKISNLEKTIAK